MSEKKKFKENLEKRELFSEQFNFSICWMRQLMFLRDRYWDYARVLFRIYNERTTNILYVRG
jgi:hypothetical protein